MVCLGFKPGAEGWKALTNPLSYSGTPIMPQTYYINLESEIVKRNEFKIHSTYRPA